jgi:hypothetical protein
MQAVKKEGAGDAQEGEEGGEGKEDGTALEELLKGMRGMNGGGGAAAGGGSKNSKDVHKSLAQEWADKFGGVASNGGAKKREVQTRTVPTSCLRPHALAA